MQRRDALKFLPMVRRITPNMRPDFPRFAFVDFAPEFD